MRDEKLEKIGSEIYAIISKFSSEKINKLPKDMITLFWSFKDKGEKIYIDLNKSAYDQDNISEETKGIIFYLYITYWLDEEDRKKAIHKLKDNENQQVSIESFEKNISKYNENIQREKEKVDNTSVELAVYERKNAFVKLLNKIRQLVKLSAPLWVRTSKHKNHN